MKTYAELFNLYKNKIDKKDESSLKFIFLQTLLENQLDYYKDSFKNVDKKIEKLIDLRFKRVIKGEPAQYIIGYTYFYGYKINVNKNVLIPRFDTEVLVEKVINDFKNKKVSIVDVGTGSGCISIALKKQLPLASVSASDLSSKALKVAEQNFKYNKASITTYKGNLLTPLISRNLKFDVIVANLPYISIHDKDLDLQVKAYEPKLALYSLDKGLDHIKRLIQDAPQLFKTQGSIYLEIGHKQAKPVTKFIERKFSDKATIEIIKDLNGKNRVVKIKFNFA